MTRAPVLAAPSGPASPSSRNVLADLLTDIAELGLQARVLTEWVAGEPDVRVQAWRDDSPGTVELLWPGPDATWPTHVYAVRIKERERAVWYSSHSRAAAPDIVRFLCDLLLLDAAALHRRYRLLG